MPRNNQAEPTIRNVHESYREPSIPRENLVHVLEQVLDGNTQVVILYGQDGIGKSTVLRQFANAHVGRTFSLFVSGASRWAHDPQDLAADLFGQIERRLTGQEPDLESVDALVLGKTFRRLSRKFDRDGMIYFILDGLEDLPPEDEATRRQLLDLLPFGRDPRFRFLLSARQATDLPLEPAVLHTAKDYLLPGFSREEVRQYLEGTGLTDPQLEEVSQITKGIAGRLVVVRRLLATGRDPATLIAQLPTAAPELFQLEWGLVDRSDRFQLLALAVLAFEHRAFTADEIADLIQLAPAEIESKLEGLTFLRKDNEAWHFITEGDRRFAREELQHLRIEVNERIIEFLQRDPESPASLQELPTYFVSANRLRDLVEYLSPARFARLYDTASSLTVVQQQADRGIQAARELQRDSELVRFALQKSTIQEIASSDIAVSEVRAMTAVADYDTAMALAESASRTEVKFRLLSAIARARKEAGMPEDPALIARIRKIFEELDLSALGEQRVSTALDLLHTMPELAVGLVSEGASGAQGEQSMDWGVVRLTLQAQLTEADPNARRYAEKLHQDIQDPGNRSLSMATTLLLTGVSAEETLAQVERLDATSDQLFVLQHWMLANRESTDAVKVLEHALRLALQAKTYAVNASVYRQLAVVLPYINNAHEARYYLDSFDAQRAVLEHTGPAEDFFRLQLILARTQWRWDQDAAKSRFLTLYNTATEIDDPVIRIAVMARLSATLARIDPAQLMDDTLHEVVDQELADRIDDVLRWSADHYEILRGVIHAIAGPRPDRVLEIIQLINTEWRRDQAYQEFISAIVTVPTDELSTPSIHTALNNISRAENFDDAVTTLVTSIARRNLSEQDIKNLTDVLLRATDLKSAGARARVCAQVAGWLAERTPPPEGLIKLLLETLDAAWTAIDVGWQKLDTAAEIIAALARSNPGAARQYVIEYNRLKEQLSFPDAESVTAGHAGLMLAIRAYGGLVAHKLADIPRDEERLLAAISQFSAVEDQAYLVSVLATRYYFAGAQDQCKHLVEGRLADLLHTLPEADPMQRASVIVDVAPALYLGAPGIASAFLGALDVTSRDDALYRTAWVLLTKVPSGDSYNTSRRLGFNITYEEANRVIELIRRMESDTEIFALIVALVDSADPQRHSGKFNRQQLAALVQRLDEVVKEKFPNERFIRHNGYVIAAQAHINRLRDRSRLVPFDQLMGEARKIPNVSDRAFVQAIIATTVREHQVRDRIVSETVDLLETIPMLAERIERYTAFSDMLAAVDAHRSKELARQAQQLLMRGEGASTAARRRSLLQVAYRLGPEFAASVASALSDDPAKDGVEHQMQLFKLAESLTASKRDQNREIAPEVDFDMSRAAWIKLGELNAGLAKTVTPESAMTYLQFAAAQPISAAYPIFAWFIENAVRRLVYGAADVRQFVLPLFEACLRGAELAIHAAAPKSRHGNRSMEIEPGPVNEDIQTMLVSEGHRPEALQVLRTWLAEQTHERLYIMDPYFGPDSVDLLKLVQETGREWEVLIVTGPDAVKRASRPYVDAYLAAWREQSTEEVPVARVTILQTRVSKACPVHDRWWLTESTGLQIGTSFNGLGGRLSTVREIPPDEVAAVHRELDPYFTQMRLTYEGERLDYDTFVL